MSKWSGPYGPLPQDSTALPDLVRATACRVPDRAALIDAASGRALSYGALAERIDRVAAGLGARGFGTGDVLALWSPNAAAWAELALGAMAAGGAVTGITPRATRREVVAQVRDARASLLATTPALVAEARAAVADAGVGQVIGVGEVTAGVAPPHVALGPERLALLPYSSGTTGLPKGVVLTHGNLAAAARQLGVGLRPTERDVFVALAPFAHVMGFVVSLATPLVAGASVVVLARFELGALLGAIERHRATVVPVPTPVLRALARDAAVDRHDLSSLELIAAGGAPVGAELQREVEARFPTVVFGQGYGMTETSSTIPVPDRRGGTPPGSVGQLAPSTELRVVDPAAGGDLGPGQRGELWVRGPQVMAGYLGRPDATAEILDADGWLRTGDLGYVGDAGCIHVVDRLKELIKVNAHQVAPAELEALMARHPAVADVAVVARPDDRVGEVPVAAVVAREPVDSVALMDWVAAQVSPHKRIRGVRFVDEIPRTPAGKVLRRVLVESEATSPARA